MLRPNPRPPKGLTFDSDAPLAPIMLEYNAPCSVLCSNMLWTFWYRNTDVRPSEPATAEPLSLGRTVSLLALYSHLSNLVVPLVTLISETLNMG